ncbi:flagellar assembly peptidoglycan hydrolase FlgJ [Methylomonas methanica]|uniref:Peptidoglycan hydrolase FlgJ n=1 Tax=Methylomonas methanica (strain DSM 25384 / MC09) TaxID=857087 RepID=F9ZV37_METMM|nr:flagellar assembly peptidoglycan hydrolase FlgJ [Methylomonas methanica]AEF99470.1 flagellar rod assembly protein/muramidase FlgJ [Methylomonas methanica MC09]
MLNTDTASVYTDFNGLAKLKQGAREQTPEAIKEVAKQFESVFLTMVLKSMRQAKLAEGAMDNKQSEFYRDMYDQQMAIHLAGKPGVGLADLIAKQLSPKQKSENDEEMQAGDFLNRAMSVGARPVDQSFNTVPSVANPHAATLQAMEESGLNRLQESLERLEQSQKALDEQWQAMQSGLGGEMALNKQMFMSQLLPHARQAADELGVDANVLLAQAALETGWGKSVIKNSQGESSFNLFNIKADKSWQGQQNQVSTLEYENGVARKEMAGFRSYGSYKQSFDDYVKFIKSNPRYSEALKKADNPAQYVRELQKAGYATDPRYAEKIMSIYNSQIADRALVSAG